LDSGQTEVTHCLDTLFFETRTFPKNLDAFDALLLPLSQPGLNLFDVQLLLDSFQDSDFLFQETNSLSDHDGGIQLMTVHASKGLEFDHVFLVDTVRQLPQDSPGLLLKAGLPPGIRFWEHDKKVVSSSYQSLLEERRLKDAQESRRILYVALTRAKKSLTAFLPQESALSYPKSSWAILLTEAGVGERAREGISHSTPSPSSQIDST
jgi:ATP-dependent exoDNAse (exonuclease V) beta subunit